jgi:ADP-ribosylation factor-like protein 5B
VEQIVYKNIKFECWDLGGQESLRNSWKTYFLGAHAVVLVVDSTDRERVGMVRAELQGLVALEALASAVVLVFANKQDLHDAMSAAEITEALALSAVRSHEWHIQACCALTGEGLTEGLEWIARRLCA